MSRIRANTITNKGANGAPDFPNGITVTGVVTATTLNQTINGDLTVSGNIGVGGTLTYEDVTNIDSIGIITARGGIKIGPSAGVAGTFYADGSYRTAGIVTATEFYGGGGNLTGIDATKIITGNTQVQTIDTGSDGHVKVLTEGTERLRVVSNGKVGIGTDNPNATLTVSHAANTADGIQVQNTNNSQGSAIAQVLISGGDNAYGSLKLECNGTNHSIQQDGNGHLKFVNASTERLRIGSSGQIGLAGANYGTSGQVLTSGGASAAPTWGSAGGITDFDEWYVSGNIAGDQDPFTSWTRSNTSDPRHGVLGGAMSHSSGIWTFPSTGYWFISFTGWIFNQNRKNRYAQFRIQTTSNNSSYQEQAAGGCRNEDDNGDGNGATYVSAHSQTIFDCQNTSNYKVKFTVDMEDNSSQTMGGRNFTSFTVIKLANT